MLLVYEEESSLVNLISDFYGIKTVYENYRLKIGGLTFINCYKIFPASLANFVTLTYKGKLYIASDFDFPECDESLLIYSSFFYYRNFLDEKFFIDTIEFDNIKNIIMSIKDKVYADIDLDPYCLLINTDLSEILVEFKDIYEVSSENKKDCLAFLFMFFLFKKTEDEFSIDFLYVYIAALASFTFTLLEYFEVVLNTISE